MWGSRVARDHAFKVSIADCLRDHRADLIGTAIRGIDDLRFVVQPHAGRLGVGLQVSESERGRTPIGVAFDAPTEGFPVGVDRRLRDVDRAVGVPPRGAGPIRRLRG